MTEKIQWFDEGKWRPWKGDWKSAQEWYPNVIKRRRVNGKWEYTSIEVLDSTNKKARKWGRKQIAMAVRTKRKIMNPLRFLTG